MIKISNELKQLLESRSCEIVPVVEIYDRTTVDIASIAAPGSAIARFSDMCFTWINDSGSYDYEAKITDFPSIKTHLSDKQNECEVTISNTERGEKSGARFILNHALKGTWMVIRLIFPELPNESWVIWWGKSLRPGRVDNKAVSLAATQEIGNYKTQIPFRGYSPRCPLVPGKGDCMGNIPLSEHTIAYQEAYYKYGTMLCPDRTYETCLKLGNTQFFQGQRVVAVSGQFSYVVKDDPNTTQKKNKKKEIKTESWSSINQSDSNEIVALGFGRFQLAGHPFTWADNGTEVKSLQGFCEGPISDFDFIKCRNLTLTLSGEPIEHYGDYGNSGSQSPDTLFGGFSGFNSKLAYLEVTTTGSQPEEVDEAPLVTAVIRGLKIPVPDVNDEYTLLASSDNPVHITRFLFTDEKYGRVPTYRIDDERNLLTSDVCDTLVEDRSQCESIVLPENEYSNYGIGYRRYRSTGVHTAYTDMYENGQFPNSIHPDFEEPWIRWYRPYEQQPLLSRQNVIRRRYTCNGALQEKTSLLDFLQKRIMPTFRGWINYNRKGKIEIRTREPADNAYLRANTEVGSNLIPITNISKWRTNRDGYVVIGVGKENAEVGVVERVLYSPGCNNLPISVETTGSLSAHVSPIANGSITSQGIGYVDITGSVTSNSSIKLKFNNSPDDFYISYSTDGIEDLQTVARMVTAHLNANPDFANYLTAYIVPTRPTRIYIRCEAGYLELKKPLEYVHSLGNEIMRVAAVFENCNDLFSDNSANFDNIIIDSFTWNDVQQDDDVNAIKGIFTSAVDDFHVANIISRTSWDTIDQEAELNEEELDLKFVDNYWQAAYLTKAYAIENIDGNLPFTWRTGLSGFMLELGDVVAVRHDSGDGALRYTPVWISSISYDISSFTTNIEGKLYLSSAWDERVQSIEPLLTTTLNPNFPPETPPALGSSGGTGAASPYSKICVNRDINWLNNARYSPCGDDLI